MRGFDIAIYFGLARYQYSELVADEKCLDTFDIETCAQPSKK